MKTGILHPLGRKCVVAAIAVAAMLAVPASAVTLVNDSFTDNERSTQSLPGSAQWFGASGTTTLDASSGALVLPAVTNSGAIGFFTTAGAPLTLNVGDSLKLSFSITTPASGGQVNDNTFLYGLLDSGGTRPTGDGVFNGAVFNGDVGYFAAAPLVGAHTARNKIVQRVAGANNLITSANFSQIGLGTNTPNLAAGGTYTYSLLLELDSETQMTLTSNMGGVEVVRVDDAGLVTAFDTMFIFTGPNPATTIDNVVVEYTPVPEPATLGLAGAGLVGLLGRRSRRRGSPC